MYERLERFKTCPDCGSERFLKGPEGGLCVNFICANQECGSKFNDMGPLGIERISDPKPLKKVPICYRCVHRFDLEFDAHSGCRMISAIVTAKAHGIENGWFYWPLNFDPIWLESCDSFSEDSANSFVIHGISARAIQAAIDFYLSNRREQK